MKKTHEIELLCYEVDVTVNEKPRWGYQHPEAPKYVGIAPDLGSFDAQFFKVHRKLGVAMDVLSRKLLEHAYQAIYDAGISSVELRGKKVGVFIGSAISDCEKVCFYVPATINALGIAGCSRSMFANRISYWLDARGPSINIDAACSSSVVALERACDYMKRGICEAAIVGGANLCFHPHVSVHYKSFQESAPSYTMVKKWARLFQQGRESCEDDPRPGRPVTVLTEENVQKIERLVLADRRIKLWQIAEELQIS
ncbi:Fatty acid synthase [Eumeta japonica]|uniref:Fatty acid synthase n=1 Tax=Eumeta variegata TaxID=151549 RepID=A0A4C1XNX9_EUMVA|nr:Fatty acid synthase [Eumeta japonica]